MAASAFSFCSSAALREAASAPSSSAFSRDACKAASSSAALREASRAASSSAALREASRAASSSAAFRDASRAACSSAALRVASATACSSAITREAASAASSSALFLLWILKAITPIAIKAIAIMTTAIVFRIRISLSLRLLASARLRLLLASLSLLGLSAILTVLHQCQYQRCSVRFSYLPSLQARSTDPPRNRGSSSPEMRDTDRIFRARLCPELHCSCRAGGTRIRSHDP